MHGAGRGRGTGAGRRFGPLLTALVALASPALAGEGRIPIDQDRAVAGGVTASDTAGFPVTLDTPGTYVLTGPVTVPDQNTTAIEVTAANVTIDLNGFKMSGPVSCTGSGAALSCSPLGTGIGIQGSVAGTTVRNGLIRGFGDDGVSLGDDAVVEDVSFFHNGGGAIIVLDGARVSGCQIVSNYAGGIQGNGESLIVEHSQVQWNRLAGISKASTEKGGRLHGNVVRGNGSDGINVGSSVIEDNAVFANQGDGVALSGAGSLVRGNSIRSNTGTGIDSNSANVDGYTHNSLDANGTAVSDALAIGNNSCSGSLCP